MTNKRCTQLKNPSLPGKEKQTQISKNKKCKRLFVIVTIYHFVSTTMTEKITNVDKDVE